MHLFSNPLHDRPLTCMHAFDVLLRMAGIGTDINIELHTLRC